VPTLALWAASAAAEFHTYKIEQIFSNADGTVQFVVMHESEGMSAENFWTGNEFTSTHVGMTQTIIFRNDLPGAMCGYYGCGGGGTANTRVLIASQGFAALHLVTPDFTMPNGFIATNGATPTMPGRSGDLQPLPTDGAHALIATGGRRTRRPIRGSAGFSRSRPPPTTKAWWPRPRNRSRWRINFAHQGTPSSPRGSPMT
jgi:hypothetical protein